MRLVWRSVVVSLGTGLSLSRLPVAAVDGSLVVLDRREALEGAVRRVLAHTLGRAGEVLGEAAVGAGGHAVDVERVARVVVVAAALLLPLLLIGPAVVRGAAVRAVN